MSRGVIKGAHQSYAIWIKQQTIHQKFRTTVFTTKYMINIYINFYMSSIVSYYALYV